MGYGVPMLVLLSLAAFLAEASEMIVGLAAYAFLVLLSLYLAGTGSVLDEASVPLVDE